MTHPDKYQDGLQRAYEDRRTVRPRFTPIEARNLAEYLAHELATQPVGRKLGSVLHELHRAIDDGARAQLFPDLTVSDKPDEPGERDE